MEYKTCSTDVVVYYVIYGNGRVVDELSCGITNLNSCADNYRHDIFLPSAIADCIYTWKKFNFRCQFKRNDDYYGKIRPVDDVKVTIPVHSERKSGNLHNAGYCQNHINEYQRIWISLENLDSENNNNSSLWITIKSIGVFGGRKSEKHYPWLWLVRDDNNSVNWNRDLPW